MTIKGNIYFRYLRICGIILSGAGVLLAAVALVIFSCLVLKKQEKNVTKHCPEVSDLIATISYLRQQRLKNSNNGISENPISKLTSAGETWLFE